MEGNIYGFGLELGRLLACTCGNACALRRHSRTSGSARAYAWVGSGQENRPAAAGQEDIDHAHYIMGERSLYVRRNTHVRFSGPTYL